MPGLLAPLQVKEFRRFWIGGAVSVFGDHLTFIALPWLVLKLTGDPLAMGSVIAIAAIPRALFMLFGGALSDRFSPRLVMLLSNFLRFLLIGTLAGLTYLDAVDLPVIFVIAFLFGMADAFLFPAASAMPPRLLEKEYLAAGNSLLQGTLQLTIVFGPMVGGLMLASFGDAGAEVEGLTDRLALATVFALDALTFLVSLSMLYLVQERFSPEKGGQGSLMGSILDGLRWAWRDTPIRTFMFLMAGLSLVFRGPFMVGIPALANAHLEEGAAGYGIIISALGIGSIIGAVIAGTRKPLAYHWLGKLLLIDFMIFGSIMIFMSQVQVLGFIAALVLVAGILDGYIIVFLTTWVQQHVPAERLGRVMSVVMFVGQGLFPVSAAAAGAIAGWDLLFMLMLGGTLAIAMSLFGFAFRQVRRLGFT
jgi:MFS family permease